MKKNKDFNYFNEFINLTGYCCQSAEMLHEVLSNYNPIETENQILKIHEIEHLADKGMHIVMNKLMREFITPIEREDIISLVQNIDDVTDAIEDVIMRMHMFNIRTVRKEALEFTELIVKCTEALKTAMEDFGNFRKSKTVKDNIIEVNNLEDIGDKMYTKAVRNLYTSSKDAIEIISWTEIFNKLEKCFDECEDVANLMEGIIMKNT
jgi:predicted phosphate transport protein (TIGR00153 family)